MFVKIIFVPLMFVLCQSMDTTIGNYSDVIRGYEECGLSRIGLQTESDCFEYNRDFGSNLRNARNLEDWEAPWVVTVNTRTKIGNFTIDEGNCGGVLIDPQWVLTAAHCLGYDSYRIYFDPDISSSRYIESNTSFIYPNYTFRGNKADKAADIALIKLEHPFERLESNDSTHHVPNIICLPDRGFRLKGIQRAKIAGSGPGLDRVKTGSTRVWEIAQHHSIREHHDFGMKICPGDSGSPVWMYHMGRAFLIGTQASGFSGDADGCTSEGLTNRVYEYIDWILKTIKDN